MSFEIGANSGHGPMARFPPLAQIEYEPRIAHRLAAKARGGNLLRPKEFFNFA